MGLYELKERLEQQSVVVYVDEVFNVFESSAFYYCLNICIIVE